MDDKWNKLEIVEWHNKYASKEAIGRIWWDGIRKINDRDSNIQTFTKGFIQLK